MFRSLIATVSLAAVVLAAPGWPHWHTTTTTISSKATPTHTKTSTTSSSSSTSPMSSSVPTSTLPSSTTPTQTSTVSSSTPTSTQVVSPADEAAYLTAHNTLRAAHNATALVWNQTLSDAAAAWAGKCVFEHSGGTLGPYGENLAAGTNETPEQACDSWSSEESSYNASDPQPSHYTQMVWKGTYQLGCAYVNCSAGTIFPAEYGQTPFHVCEYFPQGNVIGWFPENVQ